MSRRALRWLRNCIRNLCDNPGAIAGACALALVLGGPVSAGSGFEPCNDHNCRLCFPFSLV
jgi:hypothetical protein